MIIYSDITNRILAQLEAGVIPWRKTWTLGLPRSLGSGKDYRGINILVLGSRPYSSRYWTTYREAQRLGGHVRKGERATPVVYWHWLTEEELARLRAKTGAKDLAPCVPFTSAVFNLDQVEGVARPADDGQTRTPPGLEIAEKVFAVMPDKPEIIHCHNVGPAYSIALDRVTLPHLSQFESAGEYFSTLYHELTHAVGHPRRLNRFAHGEGDARERYGFEELVAEFGAAFLCGFAGLNNPLSAELSAAYIRGWSEVFRRDPRILLRAASAAQRAADYIRGKVAPPEEAPAA
jgi:antirestriction protein ArdC